MLLITDPTDSSHGGIVTERMLVIFVTMSLPLVVVLVGAMEAGSAVNFVFLVILSTDGCHGTDYLLTRFMPCRVMLYAFLL